MYNYLLVLLEQGAVPFCHYSNPYYLAPPGEAMSVDELDRLVTYAAEHGIFLNFLYGKHRLAPAAEAIIEGAAHVKLVPPELHPTYPDSVVVLEADDQDSFPGLLDKSSERNIILRATAADLPRLADIVAALRGRFRRMNLHLVGQETFTPVQLERYEAELEKMARMLADCYRSGEEVEINVLSDRLLLQEMNNCDAGVRHLTVAPDGSCHICPAFYHAGAASLGHWSDALSREAANQRLLTIACAPVCSRCDAYHCKRCVYLNQRTTAEINVPSRQQCLTAHVERGVSRRLLRSLKTMRPFDQFPPIPAIAYDDPFDRAMEETWRRDAPLPPGPAVHENDDYLIQIYEMQRKILRKLGTD